VTQKVFKKRLERLFFLLAVLPVAYPGRLLYEDNPAGSRIEWVKDC
jgi:hypothetical protein